MLELNSVTLNRQQLNCNNFDMPKTPPYAAFARRLRIAVKRFELKTGDDLDQKEVAKRLGYSGGTVSDWFTGKRMPSVEQLEAIAKLLDASPGYLAFGDESEFTKPDDGESRASPSRNE
jgi:transcriptional regulator with XRE-family HTH domain